MKNYELIMQILDKSKTENVPVDIAYDMLAVDGDKDALKSAWAILNKYQTTITALRNTKNFEEINIIVNLAEQNRHEDIKEYIADLRKNGII